MQRLTARFLLMFALAGTFVPVALQALAAPPRACCRRTAAHHCLDATTPTDGPILRDAGCCNHDCYRAVTTSQWAHLQSSQIAVTAEEVSGRDIDSQPIPAATELFSVQSPRAPPAC